MSKEYSAQKASQLVQSVQHWVQDPDRPDRQVGWVQEQTYDYACPVRRLGVRWKDRKNGWHAVVLIFARLSPADIFTLLGQSPCADEDRIARAYAHFYDQRGGGIESSFGQDKSGLGITKRNKKRFQAQRLLMLLGTLAHNLLIWSRRWLCQRSDPLLATRLQHYGIKRLLRDLYHISGKLSFDRHGRLRGITLFPSSSLAQLILVPLQKSLALSRIAVILDKT